MVANQASCLEAAAEQKSRVEDKVMNVRAKLFKAEEKVAELEAANSALNIARDKAVAG